MSREHELPSSISDENSSQFDTLPSIIENDTEPNSLNSLRKELSRHSNPLSSIPYIDDQEISEINPSSSDVSHKISLSESDFLSSLHRNLNKQIPDDQLDDDILFLEWDKERILFQDYINSLRKEIRVLLQERLEYQQKQIHPELKHINDDQMKIDLLQKSLEEKNSIIEQLQTEYELIKEKNTNLIRQISLVQCDTKSYIGIIDELKQKLTDLTIDLQNHVLVKRRLEMSINNLENDCKIIDAERIRLTNDFKESQHQKQDIEKSLQKANVQIAEQGSTIEMLRSENVQVRSQLSTIQRRMFQEKQQIMDYLRQIENDLIEKEQIKQREALLRQDYEQLKNSIHQDQQKIQDLQQECSQLLKTIKNQNEEKDRFQSEIKQLYSHFHIPIESSERSLDNIFQPIENRFNDLQNQCDTLIDRVNELQTIAMNQTGDEKSDREDELRQNLVMLSAQCAQLEAANQAWQAFQQAQLENFRNKFRNNLPLENNFTFDEIAQSIIDYLNQLTNKGNHSELFLSNQTDLTPSDEISTQSTPSLINDHDAELRQLRDNIEVLNIQCAQLDKANRAWQQYQLAQLDHFRNKFRDYLLLDENVSFDEATQLIVDQITKEREELEKTNEELRLESATNLDTIKQSYINAINELTQELSVVKQELDKRTDEIDQQQSNVRLGTIEILRNRLGDSLPIDYNLPFDEIVQQIADQIRKDREEINERYQELEKENRDLRSESENNLETIHQSYLNTVDELNRELLALKEQFVNNRQEPDIYEQLRNVLPISNEATLDDIISHINNLTEENNVFKQKEISLTKDLEHVNQQLINVYQQCEQLQEYNKQLLVEKPDNILLQNQCTQLDNANQAWQQFYDNQLNFMKNQFKDYLNFDKDLNFDQIIRMIVTELEKQNHPSETTNNGNHLSQQSSTDSQELERLQEEIESLENQLQDNRSYIDLLKNSLELTMQENEQLKQQNHDLTNRLNDQILHSPIEESPIHVLHPVQSSNTDEIDQLQAHISLLTARCDQLDEANRAWLEFHQNQLEIFREKLEDLISIDPNSSLEQMAEKILHQFDSLQKQLLNYQSNELILDQNLEQLNQKLSDVHKQCEDIREHNSQLILSNKQLEEQTQQQIPSKIHQQNQTESSWSISNEDENPWNTEIDNEQLMEYIDEISSLSSNELFDHLNKECEQILSKQNLKLSSSSPKLDLNQLALVAIHSLSNQHLIDEAKQLYNETVIRALKQEYELLSSEKNDLIEQIESESLQSKENISPRTNHFTVEDDQEQVNHDAFRIMKNKIDQIVNERPELFPELSIDPIERFDQLISAIKQLIEERNQAREDKSAIDKENQNLKSVLSDLDEQRIASSTRLSQTMDHEIQTDDQQQDKSVQINNKLKRALQTIKERVHRIVSEKPELFPQMSEDTIERIDQLVSTVENQAEQIEMLQNERDQTQKQIDELQQNLSEKDEERTLLQQRLDNVELEFPKTIESLQQEQTVQSSESQREIEQLKEEIIQLKETETSLNKSIQSWTDTIEQQTKELTDLSEKYLSLGQSHDELTRQKKEDEIRLNEYQNQIDNLMEELQKKTIPSIQTIDHESQTDDHQHDKLVQMNNKLKRVLQLFKEKIQRVVAERPDIFDGVGEETSERLDHLISTVENQATQIDTLHAEHNQVEEQLRNEIKQLQSSLETFQNDLDNERQIKTDLDRQKNETEHQINYYRNQMEDLIQERTNILKELENKSALSMQTANDDQHGEIVQENKQLKNVLQTFEDRIKRVVSERPDLFETIGEETSEQFEHLISTIENQAKEIVVLHTECDQIEEQLQNEIKQLQKSLETCQSELDDERQMKMEQLSSPHEDNSPSMIENYQNQIEELEHSLLQNEEERTLLREHLKEVESQFAKTSDDYASIKAEHESFVQQQSIQSTISQHEIEQLKEQIVELQQLPDCHDVEAQTDEDIEALHQTIDEQSQQLKDLNEKTASISSQLESQAELIRQKEEIEERLNEYKNQIDHLVEERTNLLKEIGAKTQTVDHESQTDDRQHEKLVQLNNKLKRALQSVKEKIQRVVAERPDLFDNVSEDASDRLDRLIATVQNQAEQVNILQTERNQVVEEHQRQIKELQSSLEASQYELENERRVKMQAPVFTASLSAPSTNDISSADVENYEKQIKQLQRNLSQKDDERTLLRERLNDVELELSKTLEDLALAKDQCGVLIKERNALVDQQTLQSTENQREIQQLKEELAELQQLPVTDHAQIQTEEDINSLYELIEQQPQQLKDLNDKNTTLSSQLDRQKKETEEQVENYKHQIANLLEEIEKKTIPSIQTIDHESQTDDHQHDKLVQMNNKLKRVLQLFKEKIQRVVAERPDIFDSVGEETSERLDHLISTVQNQTTQIDTLHAEHNQVEEQLRNEIKQLQSSLETFQNDLDNERQIKTEQLSSSPNDNSDSMIEEYQNKIEQLQRNLLEKDNETNSLSQRLNELQLELQRTADDHTSKSNKHEQNLQSMIEQQTIYSKEQEQIIEQLKQENNQIREELVELKRPIDYQQVEIQTDEDINALNELVEQQTEQLKMLNEKCLDLSSQLDSKAQLQADLDRQKNESENQITYYKNQMEDLMQERTKILKELENKSALSMQTANDDQHDEIVEENNQLKDVLQTFEDRIKRVVSERPDLFETIGEETSQQFEHLISTIENQAKEIVVLHAERDQIEKQLQNEIKQLQKSLETCESELDDERQMKMEQLSSPHEDNSSSMIEYYQKQIEELHQNRSEKDEERTLLHERLNEVELELKKTSDDHASTIAKYESLAEEQDALVKQQSLQSTESQREIEQLKEQIVQLQQLPDCHHVEAQTYEDIEALHQTIDEQSQQLKDLNEKTASLSSQLESQAELIRQKLKERENEIDNFVQERRNLLEEIDKKNVAVRERTDNGSQTDDHEDEKLAQANKKFKRALHKVKNQIQRIVTERPELFDGVGEDSNERLDQLISIVENQTAQIDVLQAERNQVEEHLQNEIKQLQCSLEISQNELDNERQMKMEQLSSSLEENSAAIMEEHQKHIEQLQETLSKKDNEINSLNQRLNSFELELQKTIDDHTSKSNKYEESLQSLALERDALIEQQAMHSEEHAQKIQQLKEENDQMSEELVELKRPIDFQQVEVQTDEDINVLHQMVEQQTEQLKTLNEKCLDLSSQVDSNAQLQVDVDRQKNESENQITYYKNQMEDLMQERTKILKELENQTALSVQTTDGESQTDDDQHENTAKVDKKSKRALQTFKDKIQRMVTERPNLFAGIGEEPGERFDHLLSTVEDQATEIGTLQAERNEVEEKLQHKIKELETHYRSLETSQNKVENEHPTKSEQLSTQLEDKSASMIDEYEKQIQELQQTLSEKDNECNALSEHLKKVELELRNTADNHISTATKYESLIQERDALGEQQALHSAQSQREIDHLKEQIVELQQLPDSRHVEAQTDEDIEALHQMIDQQSQQLKDLNEKTASLSSQLESQAELIRQKTEIEERINARENEIENLIQERTNLLEEIKKKTVPAIQTTESESQTDDDQRETLVQINNQLKGVLQTFEDKVHQAVTDRPNLFDGVGEETNERFDHLISTIGNQATQIDVLRAERCQIEEQLQNEIKQLQSSLETSQNELDNERQIKMEQLSSLSEDNSASKIEDYEKQIEQLQHNLAQKDEEQSLLQERLNEVELELKKTSDDHASTTAKYESLVEEQDALVKQQSLQSTESQREIEELKGKIVELQQLPDCHDVEAQTDEDIEALHQMIDQQSQQLKDLNENTASLSSQLESQAELIRQKETIEERLKERENEIDNFVQERRNLLEEIEKKNVAVRERTDSGSQTDDHEDETLVQANKKLKRALHKVKNQIQRVVTERPDLFEGVGEDSNERLDHLILIVDYQAAEIDAVQAERNQVEKQLREENKELQSTVEAYRYQIENERPIKPEQLLTASPVEDISSSVIEDLKKEINQLRQDLLQKEDERILIQEHLDEIELKLKKTLDDQTSTMSKYQSVVNERDALIEQQTVSSTESQREIEQLKKDLAELQQSPDYRQKEIQTDESIKSWDDMTEQIKDLNEKNTLLSSQLSSQVELNKQKEEIQERLTEREEQIDHLMKERVKLLEDIEKNIPIPIQITENQIQTDDNEHEKILDMNKSLTSTLETIKDKCRSILTERPDLFGDIDEDTGERLDRLISSIKTQASHISELQNSFDLYRQQTDEYIASLTPITSEIETQTIDFPLSENPNTHQSDDSDSNGWFDASPDITEKQEIVHQQFRDIDIQCELEDLSSPQLSSEAEMENLKSKIQQIALEYSTLSNEDPFENLNQITSLIKNLQNEIKDVQSSFDTYRNEIENERMIQMDQIRPHHVQTQTLGLSMYEEHERRLEKLKENELIYQRKIEHLIEERNQARDLLTHSKEASNKHSLNLDRNLLEQTKQSSRIDVAIQTFNDLDLLATSEQAISRRIFEHEMLAWSKESEQLKRFVKQIQIENNKLKDMIQTLENTIHDYIHENERLKQENHHLSWMNYSSIQNENFTTSDKDVCYLTLKWLTYEVAQRTEQIVTVTNDFEQKQQSNDTERQMKTLRVQNERLKNQLETYTIQFKHIQHEMSVKIQEMSTLKDALGRLHTDEVQSRLEIDRLKSELQTDQIKIQQLECELSDLKFKQSSKDNQSIDNLRELLQLKERELNALKEKLDYTKQTHQIELQEALKANQFSLDNVKRFEQMDLCHEEKRRELETRLANFCRITRPLIHNQQLFIENPVINTEELRKLIAETDTQEQILSSLSPIRDCLSLLEVQMKDLHHSIIENHARRSKRWKYKLGFECLSCESRWEVTHHIHDLQEACLDPSRFLESSVVEPMAGCSCPIMIDFVESDIRLCLDDMLNDICVRTTVK